MILAAVFFLQFPSISFESPPSASKEQYDWIQVLPRGSGREEHRWVEGTWPRLYLPPVVRGDTLFLFGKNFTFTTTDGKRWHRRRHNGIWGERYGAAHVVFNDRFWILGGMKSWDRFENDIWVSDDGYRWVKIVENAPWSERRGHSVFAHQGFLWIVGGAESSGKSNILPSRSLADAWVSRNGSNWERVTQSGPWAEEYSREFFSTEVASYSFLGALWVLGGPESTFWRSEDGQEWQRKSNSPGDAARLAGKVIVFDEKLWLFGGLNRNDIWSSARGSNWTHEGSAPWSERAPGQSVVFLGRLWVFGGKTGRSNDPGDDIWMLQKRSSSP